MDKELEEAYNRIGYLEFMLDYLYEALGPSNDDVMEMAQEMWEAEQEEQS